MTSTPAPRVVLLAGGVGGSTFATGLRDELAERGGELAVVCNTGDDLWLNGLRLQPDVDSMLYALAGVKDLAQGWGRAGDSRRVADELAAWGVGWEWFLLGDLDLGAHIARTSWLREGLNPTEAVARLQSRWDLGATLLPMTDTEVDTHVILDAAGHRLHFQEWWTRHRARLEPVRFENPGIEASAPAPGVLEAIAGADAILVAPSNPIVSIGPILAVPGLADALQTAAAPVAGVSPIIGDAPVRGMADVCLRVAGVPCTTAGVAAHYGARGDGGVLDAWLIAEEDAKAAASVAALGIAAHVEPLWMTDAARTRALAVAALRAVGL
ncbi:2-phospho-L-lactate transferase [Microbacterium oleivorans]|uniref:2-phospho-L-lactate transferase n=1 Tax=Microbacterium oleivorans TaxID=273677 RepID=UPI00203B6213|nr:2-phospho-L-lactate transferase [Microbacterium oleivorans]MCM3695528.1 2-phospho-L-lactate transferase [Microbacterium oleivorans]